MRKSFIIGLLLIVLPTFAICLAAQNTPAKAFIKENNVYIAFTDGTQKQLTFNGSDRDPFLLATEGKIVYVRETQVSSRYGTYSTKKLMKVDISTLVESIITDQKPYQDGLDATYDILNVISPMLSLDKKYLIFITEKYATGNQLVKVDLQSGKWTELFSAESFELIEKGTFKGMYLVGISEVGSQGRDVYHKLCDEKGDVIKEFDSWESMMKFRNEIR